MIRVLQMAIGVEWRNGMKLYVQFMIILVFSFLGEAISTIFHLPIPGSIIGLILLFSPRVQINSSSPHSYGWKFFAG